MDVGHILCVSFFPFCIGTPKTINFSFVSNGKLMVFRCPITQAHYYEAVIDLNFGTPKNNEFSMENLLFIGVPILKHIRVNVKKNSECVQTISFDIKNVF